MYQLIVFLLFVLALAAVAVYLTVLELRSATGLEKELVQPWQLESRRAQEVSLARLRELDQKDEH